MESIIVPIDDLIERIEEMESHSMDFVQITLYDAEEDMPARAVFTGHRLDMSDCEFVYDDIEAVELPNDIVYVDAEVVEHDALPSPMLPD